MPKDFNSTTNISSQIVAGFVTQVLTGTGVLERVVVNVSTAVKIGIYDAADTNTATVIGIIRKNATTGDYTYNGTIGKGIRVITTGAQDNSIRPNITIVWRQ